MKVHLDKNRENHQKQEQEAGIHTSESRPPGRPAEVVVLPQLKGTSKKMILTKKKKRMKEIKPLQKNIANYYFHISAIIFSKLRSP